MKRFLTIAALLISTGAAASETSIYKWTHIAFTETNAFVHVGEGRSEADRIGLINREINQSTRYVADVEDYWQSPSETLQRHAGDCEDIAILKIQALMNIGIAKDRLTMLVVLDKRSHEFHAVVQVNLDGQDVILDSRNLQLVPAKIYPNIILYPFKVP